MAKSTYIPRPGGAAASQGGAGTTPMMAQFQRAKREAPGCLLFFRMGDFYELFGDDAAVAARELGIALTSRDKGSNPLPMAGVPVRAVDGYLLKLVRKGFKVAICEQMEDPRSAKGIVDRQVVRVVTAGTLTEEEALDAREPNWLSAVHLEAERAGLAWVDLSTGRFLVSELSAGALADEIARIGPAELLWSSDCPEQHPAVSEAIRRLLGRRISEREPWRFARDGALRALQAQLGVATLEGFGIERDSAAVPAAGALIEYLQETQKSACKHVRRLERVESSSALVLDRATRSCLELVRTQRDGRREGTLLDTLDATLTPMGGRLLREWLLAPLCEVEPILARQKAVGELVDRPFLREDVRELLRPVLDIERLVGKLATGRANARDVAGLAQSLEVVPGLRDKLDGSYSALLGALQAALDPLDELTGRIRSTLVDAPPLALREGGLVRAGVNAELDELRQIAGDAKSAMARFQAEEIARTGLPSLKVGFNSVFGYFVEVPHSQTDRVPANYVRKQTVKNAERYITPELKQFESKVLQAEERSRDLEYELFGALREDAAREIGRMLDTAAALAALDVLAALAHKAAENRYVAPLIDAGDAIRIADGRHPVLERLLDGEPFVPNDTALDRAGRRIVILTGPNMAGKSTYIRQTALIVLMAQIGSFVPAREAQVGVVDRIFTRVGAADDISRGASTFMVEMVEVANILNNASARSLVVLDEVGRGTSTFDGLALAWAIVEHLHETIGARTLFATHYHQLTELAERLPGVANMNVAVREWNDEIVFLHKIVEGGTDRSWGIHVARLAGVPRELLERARAILRDLEDDAADLGPRISAHKAPGTGRGARVGPVQHGLFDRPESQVERALRALDPDRLAPIEALLELKRLRELVDGP
jgi:DNA mismatch repair protein MutS